MSCEWGRVDALQLEDGTNTPVVLKHRTLLCTRPVLCCALACAALVQLVLQALQGPKVQTNFPPVAAGDRFCRPRSFFLDRLWRWEMPVIDATRPLPEVFDSNVLMWACVVGCAVDSKGCTVGRDVDCTGCSVGRAVINPMREPAACRCVSRKQKSQGGVPISSWGAAVNPEELPACSVNRRRSTVLDRKEDDPRRLLPVGNIDPGLTGCRSYAVVYRMLTMIQDSRRFRSTAGMFANEMQPSSFRSRRSSAVSEMFALPCGYPSILSSFIPPFLGLSVICVHRTSSNPRALARSFSHCLPCSRSAS